MQEFLSTYPVMCPHPISMQPNGQWKAWASHKIFLLWSTRWEMRVSPIWWKKVAIFIWFELRTPSTPSIGLHPSILALCYWHSFFNSSHINIERKMDLFVCYKSYLHFTQCYILKWVWHVEHIIFKKCTFNYTELTVNTRILLLLTKCYKYSSDINTDTHLQSIW